MDDKIKLTEQQKSEIRTIFTRYYADQDKEVKKALIDLLAPDNPIIWDKIQKLIQVHLNRKLEKKIKVVYNVGSDSLLEVPRRILYRLIKAKSPLITVSKWKDWDRKSFEYHKNRPRDTRKYKDMWCWKNHTDYLTRHLFDKDGVYSFYLPDDVKVRSDELLVKAFEEVGLKKANAPSRADEMEDFLNGSTYRPKFGIKELVAGADYEIRSTSDEFGGEYIEEVQNGVNDEQSKS